ncbi:MAG TPA: MFS transporter [Bacillales bacterium]|nr:MFS transporter [Bacillales bacterium]
MKDKKTLDLMSIATIPVVMTLGNSMLIPVLPTMEKKLHISSFQSSLIITVYSLIAILLIPIAGYLSDRIGRKKVIVPSLILTGAGGLLCGLASWLTVHPFGLILAGRFVQGIGAAGAFPVVMPLIGDMFHNKRKVSSGLGLIETSNTAGKVLSPVVGALLASVIWYLPFLAIPVFCLVSLVLVLFLVKTPKEQEDPESFHQFITSVKKIFALDGKWLYAVFFIGCIAMFVLFGVLFFLSTILEDRYQTDGLMKGLILAGPLLALSTTSFITGRKIGNNKGLMKVLTLVGGILLSAAIFTGSFYENVVLFLSFFVIGGIGIGLMLPCLDAFITEGIKEKQRGTVSSIYSSMRFIGVAVGPPVFALLMRYSHRTLYLTLTIVCLLAVVLTIFLIRPSEKHEKHRNKKPIHNK